MDITGPLLYEEYTIHPLPCSLSDLLNMGVKFRQSMAVATEHAQLLLIIQGKLRDSAIGLRKGKRA